MWPFKNPPYKPESAAAVLKQLKNRIEAMNISFVVDDWDAGYDLAIDEVLTLINRKIEEIVSETEIDYSGGY